MRNRALGAITAALVVFVLSAAPASADIADLTGEIRLPQKRSIVTEWGVFPTDNDLRQSGKGNLTLAYDVFEISGKKGPAAQLIQVYVTQAILESVEFQAGEQNGVRGYWTEAAQAFASAAENLSGAAKQVALYKRMVAASNTGDPGLTLRAADELLAAAPKTYYFGPAHETRARVFAGNRQLASAIKALDTVTDAPGMNVRDYFSAAYLRVWLTTFVRAKNAGEFATAEKAFQALLTELERHPRRELAGVPKLKIMMSLAASIRSQGRSDEAKALFVQILGATKETTDKSVLAGVYYGMGDVAFEEASALQKQVKDNPILKDKVRKLLDQAALHYLRVILLYKDYADQREVFGATQGSARVFKALFDASGEKDCEVARRAYDYYRQAVRMLPQGEAQRLLVTEGKALKKRIDDLCSSDEAAPEGEGDAAGE